MPYPKYDTMQYHTIQCNHMQNYAIPYDTIQFLAVPYDAMQYIGSMKRPAEQPNGHLPENRRYPELPQDMGDL